MCILMSKKQCWVYMCLVTKGILSRHWCDRLALPSPCRQSLDDAASTLPLALQLSEQLQTRGSSEKGKHGQGINCKCRFATVKLLSAYIHLLPRRKTRKLAPQKIPAP